MLAAGVGSTLTGYVRALAFVRMVWIDQCLCPYVNMNDRPTDRPKNPKNNPPTASRPARAAGCARWW